MLLSGVTRRGFLRRLAVGSCALLTAARRREIAYEGRADYIEVFRREGEQRRRIQRLASANPSFLTIDISRGCLFAVNEVDEYEGLPRGTVESYAICPSTGRIALMGRQPLSLSAIGPRHLAISPDGGYMVVAVFGGGAYNVLPVERDGEIGAVTQVLKEIGSGANPKEQASAHPHSVAFHPSGKFVIATDFGSDRISLFSFEGGRLGRVQHIATPPGSGPADLYISRSGRHVFVEHRLQRLSSCYEFDAGNGKPSLSWRRSAPLAGDGAVETGGETGKLWSRAAPL